MVTESTHATGRALPGPVWIFWWILATVTAPMAIMPLFLRAEEILYEPSPVLWWSVAAAPVIAAVAAARQATYRRALVAGIVVGAAYLVLSFVLYRWGLPVRRLHGGELLFGLPLAVLGAAIGGLRASSRVRRPPRLLAGVVVAVFGALLAPGPWSVPPSSASTPAPFPQTTHRPGTP